ncbi:hypothetical protein LWI29_023028 [Acer saccharum]|uniref:Uncharacterized protein n=1 Tax=Acer saccharum TaxID=4024 RepID=A0AA39RMM4_ACESA|nr:hypothetical protein LWI29_023028 [Acer saccharum]
MEQQQNESAKRDAQLERLKKHIAAFDVIINHLIQTYHYERRCAENPGTIQPFVIGLPNPGVCDEYDSDGAFTSL